MKIVLAAINAKYIHSNLAVHSLKAYAGDLGEMIEIAEYTINQQSDQILADLYRRKPDFLAFSCYIWNYSYVKEIAAEIAKVLPDAKIWLGGPEVSYDPADVLKELYQVTGVMSGEGEESFRELIAGYKEGSLVLEEISGITFRNAASDIVSNPDRDSISLDKVPFPYENTGVFENRIIYYESSRGCPFSCSYCLSSAEKSVRFRSLELVERELQFFLDHRVPQVKFVDRTFNCRHEHAMGIWQYIIDHDNGITNFHFEISADLLKEDEMELLSHMRPGLVQLEIGVQSTNEKVVDEIRRTMDFEKLSKIVMRINSWGNIHQHLDLIAGLPHEDFESFRRSFNDVYELEPEQLQLGFLKVLKGSYMHQQAKEYGIVYQDKPPYEVLYTEWLTYEEVLVLKDIEELVEVYYNSRQFTNTLRELVKKFDSPFCMFDALRGYYREKAYFEVNHKRIRRYEILLAFIQQCGFRKEEMYRELLVYDLYLRENVKSRPDFAPDLSADKELIREFYRKEDGARKYLERYETYNPRQVSKMTHLEIFEHGAGENQKQGKYAILFDYMERNPLTYEAKTFKVEI